MLEIKNLSCKIKDTNKLILDKLNLNINDGEIHVIMGPNGTGKSTLAKTIMGHYSYEIVSGNILFNNEDITNLDTSLRAKKGLFISMQEAPTIQGVSNTEFLKEANNEITSEKIDLYSFITEVSQDIKDLKLKEDMLNRSINEGFSGGEKKKNEVLQLKVLKPKFIILDELDSGLDVDSLKICCDNINSYLKDYPNTSVLIITHYPRILDYIKPNYVHILYKGNIVKTGDKTLADNIEKYGYTGLSEVER